VDSREPHDSWGGGIVSCSDDYDDDIKRIESETGAFSTQLTALQAALEQAKSDAQTAHAKFVTQNELNNVEAAAKAAAQEAAATAKAEALTEAINQCKALIAGKADQTAVDALSAKVNAIDATLNKLGDVATKNDLEAVKNNLQTQINALNYLKEILPEGSDFQKILTELATLKADLEAAQQKLDGMIDASELKTMMNSLSNQVNAFNSDINVLTVLVNKMLTSVTLVPELYSDGIEAVSFDYLAYYPVEKGTSGNVVDSLAGVQRIDKGETVIKYRLSPSTVQESSIDVAHIAFVGHIAKKEDPSRAAEETPILFQGIESYQNGVLSVKAKRNPIADFSKADAGHIWVAAIKVPRKADEATGVEYAEIYSEYSMVLENTFTPQIAAVDLSKSTDVKLIPGKRAYGFAVKENPTIVEELAGKNTDGWDALKYHYYNWDFLNTTDVDKDQFVTLEIPFNQTFDLSQLVTGCKVRKNPRVASEHNHITRAELAAYGLELKFAVWDGVYIQDVDNKTNQQEFAKILEDGKTIMSKTPAGVEQNEAVIGKEPIIMVTLVDVNNGNKLVDERYFKIKWAPLEQIVEEQQTITLKEKETTVELKPCDDMNAGEYTWREFIDEVYAKIGENGMSQSDFEMYYPEKLREVKGGHSILWEYEGRQTQIVEGYDGNGPVIKTTTNEHGDALVAHWTLTPEDVERVIYNSDNPEAAKKNYKTITDTITMTPTDKSLPILKFAWTVKITVPKLPTLVGYYDQYWLDPDKYTHVDVLPVQYNTPAQRNGNYYAALGLASQSGYEHCVYDFNLTNAFVYEQVNGQVKYIVKDLYACGSYDIQIRKDQDKDKLKWWKVPSNFENNLWTKFVCDDPDARTMSWKEFPGYKLHNDSTNTEAFHMYWVEVAGSQDYKMMSTPVDYQSWDLSNANWRAAKLFADSNNKAGIEKLLNPLSKDNEVSELKQYQPVRTHDKKVKMGIWSRLNDYNYILVKSFDICLIAPLRVEALSHTGKFEDGHVSGTTVTFDQIFSMTDFRGYLVADVSRESGLTDEQKAVFKATGNYSDEQLKYPGLLYDYYGVKNVFIDTDNITYNFKRLDGSVVIDPIPEPAPGETIDSRKYKWMTAAELYRLTNGNLNFSIIKGADGKSYTFFNNGGSNIEAMCYAKIPCSVEYAFGTATTDILVPIYPHGNK